MVLAWLLLITGLTISAVAIYYSVVGLAAIFSAAVIPIVVMGSALEVAKLVCASWLKANWARAPVLLKTYMTIAVTVLMIITSMGIFGFLSKAHNDQNLVSGDVQSKIAIYDEKIKTAKENIEANRKQLKQMDEAVDQVMARSTSEEGATKANAIRKSQQRDRSALAKDIEANQKLIATLNDEAAPIRAEVRKVEAEVGPLKYIAKFIYGDKTDENMLEKAVTWVIILIVVVFDPLAVIMLLGAQMTFAWHNKGKDPLSEEKEEGDSPLEPLPVVDEVPLTVTPEPVIAQEVAELFPEAVVHEEPTEKLRVDPHPVGWAFPKHAKLQDYTVEDADEEPVEDLDEEEENETIDIREARARWKAENPNDTVKHQRRLLESGLIEELPWETMIKDEAAAEAHKWAEEHPELEEAQKAEEWAQERILTVGDVERPGDYLTPPETYMENIHGTQVKKPVEGYQQNAEQNESTLWQRVKKATGE